MTICLNEVALALAPVTARRVLPTHRHVVGAVRAAAVLALAFGSVGPVLAQVQAPAAQAAPAARAASTTPQPGPVVPLVRGPAGEVTSIELEADATQRLPPEARSRALSDKNTVGTVSSNLYVQRALAAQAVAAKLDSDPKVQAALKLARDKVLSDARVAQLDAAVEPTAAMLDGYSRSFYTANPQRFMAPEQVNVRHILISNQGPDPKARAEKLLADIKAGANFADLAKAQSIDPGSAPKGGELGFLRKGQTVAPFEEAAFALQKPNDLAPVVESRFGFHVIQLVEKRKAAPMPFDDVKEMIRGEWRSKIVQDARKIEFDRLIEAAQVDEPAIEAFNARFK